MPAQLVAEQGHLLGRAVPQRGVQRRRLPLQLHLDAPPRVPCASASASTVSGSAVAARAWRYGDPSAAACCQKASVARTRTPVNRSGTGGRCLAASGPSAGEPDEYTSGCASNSSWDRVMRWCSRSGELVAM